jgi:hypothetical protein
MDNPTLWLVILGVAAVAAFAVYWFYFRTPSKAPQQAAIAQGDDEDEDDDEGSDGQQGFNNLPKCGTNSGMPMGSSGY